MSGSFLWSDEVKFEALPYRGAMFRIRKTVLCLFVVGAASCGSNRVRYTISCTVTCNGAALSDIAAATATLCDVDGLDPNVIASMGVTACLNEAQRQCPSAVCACQSERTVTPCSG
jgi:hypothetical protein